MWEADLPKSHGDYRLLAVLSPPKRSFRKSIVSTQPLSPLKFSPPASEIAFEAPPVPGGQGGIIAGFQDPDGNPFPFSQDPSLRILPQTRKSSPIRGRDAR